MENNRIDPCSSRLISAQLKGLSPSGVLTDAERTTLSQGPSCTRGEEAVLNDLWDSIILSFLKLTIVVYFVPGVLLESLMWVISFNLTVTL